MIDPPHLTGSEALIWFLLDHDHNEGEALEDNNNKYTLGDEFFDIRQILK